MQISSRLRKAPVLQTLKQPAIMKGTQSDQNLVFVYPVLYDASLKNEINLLRAFLTVDVIGQIKTSNVLNVTASAAQIGMIGSGKRAINPAQEVRQSLWTVSSEETPTELMGFDERYNRMEYQEQINRFMNFIANQIRSNPRYTPLLPIMSSIVVDNLVTIPLIVGTKQYPVEPTILYWILLSAIATGTRLDKAANVWKLQKVVDAIPPSDYITYAFSDKTRALLLGSSKTKNENIEDERTQMSIDRYINKNLQSALGTMTAVLDPNKWAMETGGIETRDGLSLEDIPKIQTYTQARTYNAALSSFNTYLGNLLPSLIFDLEVLLGPTPVDVDMTSKTDQVIQDITEISSEMVDILSRTIVISLENISIEAEQRVKATVKKLEDIQEMCEENKDIGKNVGRILEKLDQNHLEEIIIQSQYEGFLRALSNASNSFVSYSKTYENWLLSIVDSDARSVITLGLKTLQNKIKRAVHDFIYRTYPVGNPALFDPMSPSALTSIIGHSSTRYANIKKMLPDIAIDELARFVNEFYEGVSSIIYFLFLYNFFSYTCIFMKDIDIDIEAQSQDALDFPNYCFAVPVEIIKAMYAIQRARAFKEIMQSKKLSDMPTDVDDLNIPWSNLKRIIALIARQLGVPNIIVVDKEKHCIYYKFMYMQVVNKLNTKSLENYVKHQEDVLPGF